MSNSYQTQGYIRSIMPVAASVVDPITRIEGHTRCEVNINAQNIITNAVPAAPCSAGWRSFYRARPARDAWHLSNEFGGVCTGVHALASVYAIEDAIGIKVPDNAKHHSQYYAGDALWCHDHLVHFYQLARNGLD